MVRRFLKVFSIVLVIVCVACSLSIYFAINEPAKAFLKPLPYVYAEEKQDASLKNKSTSVPQSTPVETDTKAVATMPAPTPKPKANANSNSSTNANATSSVIIDVPMIYQNPNYPTGCEPVAATMLLNHYGYDLLSTDFVDKMPKGQFPYTASDGKRYGPDPNKTFVGDPKSSSSWGIYAPAINKVINAFLQDSNRGAGSSSGTGSGNGTSKNSNGGSKSLTAVNITGASIAELKQLIDNGIPVLVWGTIDMKPSYDGLSWYIAEKSVTGSGTVEEKPTIEQAINNHNRAVMSGTNPSPNAVSTTYTLFTWTRMEHTLVLVGYDQNGYIFNDPMRGVKRYSKEDFERSYADLGSQAIYIKES